MSGIRHQSLYIRLGLQRKQHPRNLKGSKADGFPCCNNNRPTQHVATCHHSEAMDEATASTVTGGYMTAARGSFTQLKQASTDLIETSALERSAERKEKKSNGAPSGLQEHQEDCCGDAPNRYTGSTMTTDSKDTRDVESIGADHLERNSNTNQLQFGESSRDPAEKEDRADARDIENNSSIGQLLDSSRDASEREVRADREGWLSTGDNQLDGAGEAEMAQNCSHSRSTPHTVGEISACDK